VCGAGVGGPGPEGLPPDRPQGEAARLRPGSGGLSTVGTPPPRHRPRGGGQSPISRASSRCGGPGTSSLPSSSSVSPLPASGSLQALMVRQTPRSPAPLEGATCPRTGPGEGDKRISPTGEIATRALLGAMKVSEPAVGNSHRDFPRLPHV